MAHLATMRLTEQRESAGAFPSLPQHLTGAVGPPLLVPSVAETAEAMEARLCADERVWQIDGVFSATRCADIVRALSAAGERRGWDRSRHGRWLCAVS